MDPKVWLEPKWVYEIDDIEKLPPKGPQGPRFLERDFVLCDGTYEKWEFVNYRHPQPAGVGNASAI